MPQIFKKIKKEEAKKQRSVWEKLKVSELKDKLRTLEAATGGKKSELISRLEETLQSQAHSNDNGSNDSDDSGDEAGTPAVSGDYPGCLAHGRNKLYSTSGSTLLLALCIIPVLWPLVDHTDPVWECMVMFCKITCMLLKHSFTYDEVVALQDLIEEHRQKFLETHGKHNFTPKLHYLFHIPANILQFGPPRNYWCMRFEAKHRFFKRLVRSMHWLSFEMALCERHCMAQAYLKMRPEPTYWNKVVTKGAVECVVQIKDCPWALALSSKMRLAGGEDLKHTQAQEIWVRGQVFKVAQPGVDLNNSFSFSDSHS